MEPIATQNTRRDWSKLIQEAANSGLSKAEWCRRHNIKPKTLYHYERKLRLQQKSCETNLKTTFVEFTAPELNAAAEVPCPAIVLQFGKFQMRIEDNTNEATLRMVLRALRDA